MSDLYDPALLDHAKNPRHRGPLPDAHRTARADNPLCGDRVTVALTLDGERIDQIRFEGRGCAVCIASASLLTTLVEGAGASEVAALDAALRTAVDPAGPDPDPRLALLAGVRSAPSRIRCATLAWDALATALGR